MDNLVSILKMPGLNQSVKNDMLKYIQNWSLAFEGKPNLNYVDQVYKTLKSEGMLSSICHDHFTHFLRRI
jgi:growth factor-regulated tyrosine kinase substrate